MGHRKGDPRPDQQIQSLPGENARDVTLLYQLFKQPRCNMTDPMAVAERYDWYMDFCAENDMRPTVAGMALAYGYSREQLLQIKNGANKGVPAESSDTLKRAWAMLNAAMEQYMSVGRINPVSGIFLLKNNHGYKDQTESVIVRKDPYETGDPEEIARRYLAGMPAALPQENARTVQESAPVVETVVIDQTGTVE